jgi:hypothetical protein
MKERYLGQDIHELILGEKLNGFKSPKSEIEKQRIIKMAKEWIATHPNEHLNFY